MLACGGMENVQVFITADHWKKENQPNGQNRQENSLKECAIVNSALKIQCHIVKNTLLPHWESFAALRRLVEPVTR